ncbi:unnamed protein product [Linum trigynum]|uniref:(S)-ureidoglycine aminohydrolase cupin domain-containing protein n=1 Tax=Linum trigynum TaxID=586398 RepID=A0AAV2CMD2_9ROSI
MAMAGGWSGRLVLSSAYDNNNNQRKQFIPTKPIILSSTSLDLPPRATAAAFLLPAKRLRSSESGQLLPRRITVMAEGKGTATTITEKSGIKIVRNPPESKLADLGVRSWPKWGCPPSKFPWTYSAKETCYLLEGKVKVYPQGSDEGVEIAAGDLVEFPNGMSCTWDVSVAVDKHYKFE